MNGSLDDLANRILAFMTKPTATERIFRQSELERLGAPEAVETALQSLARAHRIGSPARGIWFPLEPWQDAWGQTRYAAPALLPELARALLEREGVSTRSDKATRAYDQGKTAWNVPTFMRIGVDTPAALRLEWDQGYTMTEYQGELMPAPADEPCSPVAIPDPEALRRVAARTQTRPERIEKDIWVNRALQSLSRTPSPRVPGQWHFWGGTSLSKSWQLTPRFSEDIDLRFQPSLEQPDAFFTARRPMHDWLRSWAQKELMTHMPEAALDEAASSFAPDRVGQRVVVSYASHFASTPQKMKLEMGFSSFRVAGIMRPVLAWPHWWPGQESYALGRLPCVPPWSIMAGKLHALTQIRLDEADAAVMRHVVDLGAWMRRREDAGWAAMTAYMAQQCLAEGTVRNLLDDLIYTLDLWQSDPRGMRLYREYVEGFYLGIAKQTAPDWRQALTDIRVLWDAVCGSDWENPLYAVPDPDRMPTARASKSTNLRAMDRDALPPSSQYA